MTTRFPSPIRSARRDRPSTGSSRRSIVAAALVVAGLVLGTGAAQLGAAPDGGVDPVETAELDAAAATSARAAAESRLAATSARRAELEQRTAALTDADAASTAALADARQRVRELAVAAYIDGGRTELLQSSLDPDEATAIAWRVGMVAGGAGEVTEAVEQFEQMQTANDPEQQAVAQELDAIRSQEEQARSDVVQASARERDAEVAVERAAAQRAAARAAASTTVPAPSTSATPSRTASPTPSSSSAAGLAAPKSGGGPTAEEAAFLAKVRQCESRGNYSIDRAW